MGTTTNIEWCDHTFNHVRGCTKVSEGCANCYAEKLSHRNPLVLGEWGPGKPRVVAKEGYWELPRKWNRNADPGSRPRVFCASLADWLDSEIPPEIMARLLGEICVTPNLDWLLLTKRPQNWRKLLVEALPDVRDFGIDAHAMVCAWLGGLPPGNVWIGTTCENDRRAMERIPLLLEIPAQVRFLSCEPLLGPINLAFHCFNGADSFGTMPGIHWVIAGGESGPGARPMHPNWVRWLRNDCAAAGVPFFFKQWGDFAPAGRDAKPHARVLVRESAPVGAMKDSIMFTSFQNEDEARLAEEWGGADSRFAQMARVGKKAAGRVLDGSTHEEFPSRGGSFFSTGKNSAIAR